MKREILLAIILVAFFGISYSQIYFPGETSKLLVSVTDVFGNVIENAQCYGKIFFPNNSVYVEGYLTYNPITKVYEMSYEIPEVYGEYVRYVSCEINVSGRIMKRYAFDSFFVSNLRQKLDEYIENLTRNTTIEITMNITGNISQSLEIIRENISKDIEDLMGLLLALHSTPETYTYCADESTLITVKVAEWYINNKTYNITKEEKVICPFGCDNTTIPNKCKQPTYQNYLLIAGIFFVILIIFLIIRAYI